MDRLRVVSENDILKQKLKALVDQFEARDNHFNQQVSVCKELCSYTFLLMVSCSDSLVMLTTAANKGSGVEDGGYQASRAVRAG